MYILKKYIKMRNTRAAEREAKDEASEAESTNH